MVFVMVDVYTTTRGQTKLVNQVDDITLGRCSLVARAQINKGSKQARVKRVDFHNASPEPLKWLLKKGAKPAAKLNLSVKDWKLSDAIALYEAIEAVQFRPAQPQIYSQLKHYIAYEKLSPSDVITIQQAFGHLGEDSKLWSMTAHHLAWDLRGDRFTDDEYQALVDECENYPAFNEVVLGKMAEFKQRDDKKAARAAREAAKKAAAGDRKRIQESNRRVREYKENRYLEEIHGLREASKDTVDRVMQRKVTYKVTDRTKKPPKTSEDEE